MNMEKDKFQKCESICRIFDDAVTPKELQDFEVRLHQDPELLSLYTQIAEIYGHFICPGLSMDLQDDSLPDHDSLLDMKFWQQMLREEITAPSVEIPVEKRQEAVIQKVVYPPREKRKVSKFTVIVLLNAAAILFFFLFLRFAPPKSGYEVAMLADSINAKWADMDGKMEQGTSLLTGTESLLLREGYAELLFDNHARVTIEGPAEFQILTEDQIKLRYGRLYAAVPREAIGFTVTTETAKVIDLGTEFGVEASAHGDTYLCVMKGKTSLIAGDKFNKNNIEIGKGIAKKISGLTGTVSDAVFEERLFVRHIDSADELLWRGQTEFNLADVVGGGNGFGTGRLDKGISLSDGAMESDYRGAGLKGTGDYIPVHGSTFVDGVFTPVATDKPVQISSQGHTFKECPATSGFYTVLKNGGVAKEYEGTIYPLQLNGQVYGTPENPVLSMRSNAGITFDLDAVRRAMSGCEVQAFRSVVGVSSNAVEVSKIEQTEDNGKMVDVFTDRDGKIGKATVFVLVDGQLKQTASITCDPNTIVNVDLKLTSQDRFLTLVSTQGDNEWTHDWVMFAKPRLILNTAE